jgi:hypothetical protein
LQFLAAAGRDRIGHQLVMHAEPPFAGFIPGLLQLRRRIDQIGKQ